MILTPTFRFLRQVSPTRIASAVTIIIVALAMYWQVTGRRQLDDITLPVGFTIAMYSEDGDARRALLVSDDRQGAIYRISYGEK